MSRPETTTTTNIVVHRSGARTGALMMLGSAFANQSGAALGAHAFSAMGPIGVVAVRQIIGALVLFPSVRPPLHRFTWSQWWPTIGISVAFATMNLTLYTAIDRVGLALAVTLEFLGPLSVALLGSRSLRDLAYALVAASGVYILVMPGPNSDYFGIVCALVAATCWAGYILLSRLIGTRLPGLQAPAAATALSATAFVPVVIVLIAQDKFFGAFLWYAVAAGVLCTLVPMVSDLLTLRRVPAQLFGVFMSIHPVCAALAGIVILGQSLDAHEWVGILVIVTINAVAVTQPLSVRSDQLLDRVQPEEVHTRSRTAPSRQRT